MTLEEIRLAVCNLYDSWDNLPQDSRELIIEIMKEEQLELLYVKYRDTEIAVKESLIDFENKYPNVTNEGNINDIISSLKKRKV